MKNKSYIKLVKTHLFRLFILLCISVTANADSKWESFITDVKAKSKSGDADSKGILSSFIEMDGTGGSYSEAYELASDSSSKNSFYGNYSLAKLLKNGRGVSKNSKKANDLFNKSIPLILKEAENGNPVCQYLAAECYNYGHGVDLNPKKAEKWSKKSIDKGFVASYHQLAIAYMNQEDTDFYISNLRISAQYGFAASQIALYSAIQIFAENQKELQEAKSWFQKAIDQNCASLQKSVPSAIASESRNPPNSEENAVGQKQLSSESNVNSHSNTQNVSHTDTKNNIFSDIVKVDANENQVSNLEIHTQSLKPCEYSLFEKLLSQNKREGWGPDAESIIFVNTFKDEINDMPDGREISVGLSQLWWPDRNLISTVRRFVKSIGSSGIVAPITLIIYQNKNGDTRAPNIGGYDVTIANGLYFVNDRNPLFSVDLKSIKPNYDYAINKSIEWYNKLLVNNATDTSFKKEILLSNGTSSGYAMFYDGNNEIIIMTKSGTQAKVRGVPFNGMEGGIYYLDGIGYQNFASGKAKDLEKIIYPIQFAQYQLDLLNKYHSELLNNEQNKKDLINSLN